MTAFDSLNSIQWGKFPVPKSFTSTHCQWGVWQYVLLCVYSLGIEAVFNFPICLHKHTGLFLVAYFILMILFCIPLVYIQLKIGGVFQRHITGLYGNCFPAFKGVSWAMLALALIMCIYQSVYVMYSLKFAFLSMEATYPWTYKYNYTGTNVDGTYFKGRTNAETYYYEVFLDISSSISSPGSLCWASAIVLLLVWIIIFMLTCRGPKWYGNLVVGTSVAAASCLMCLFLYGHVMLPDSGNSFSNFISASSVESKGSGIDGILPTSLSSTLTWTRALKQHIFNLALWAGVLPALGCYIGDRKLVAKVTPVILLAVHCILPIVVTSTAATFVNGLAKTKDKTLPEVMKVAQNGPGLWFVLIPEALVAMDVANIWAMLLYFTIFLITLHQQTLMFLVIMENIRASFPGEIATIFRRQEYFSAAACTLGFLLGLPLITQGGSYVLEIVELYLYRGLFILVLLSALPTAYIYVKLDPLYIPIERKFITVWLVAASVIISIILMHADDTITKAYIQIRKYSTGEEVLGVFTAVWPLLICLTLGIIHAIYTVPHGTILERIKMVFTPSMTSIYPPVVTPEQNELDIEFNRTYTPRLKTSNRFAKKKAKSSKTKGTEPKPINTEIHIDAPVEGTAV